jgi:hypothetical protein
MFYGDAMPKLLTANQILGELGEAAARQRFLTIGFQFDGRSRLEAGIDGIAEVMTEGRPLAKMIAVQVKARKEGRYTSEDDAGFAYLMRSEDLEYWRGSNLPVIVVLYRQSDESLYWQAVPRGALNEERRLVFDKAKDALNRDAVDRLAALTVPKSGFGYYVPPLGEGEEALVNILPLTLPQDIYVASTPHTGKAAAKILLDGEDPARFDWVIRGGVFWSFEDPSRSVCRHIVDLDQIEAIDTNHLAFHEDIDEQNHFAYLLRSALQHQLRRDLSWNKDRKLFYFRAFEKNQPRIFAYDSAKKRTSADVVNVSISKKDPERVDFVRHHAFEPRFELLGDQWCLVINPTYFFTTNGFTPHTHPGALLSGKKRMDNSASLRGQVIMWHRLLTQAQTGAGALFETDEASGQVLKFADPPKVQLATRVPEDVWGSPKKKAEEADTQTRMLV